MIGWEGGARYLDQSRGFGHKGASRLRNQNNHSWENIKRSQREFEFKTSPLPKRRENAADHV